MELRHLRYFVAVAERLSFTAAAESLGISQPPLSQQIRDLEAEIGTELFERTSRRVVLTQAGRDFLESARSVVERANDAVERARAIGRGTAGIINVGLTGSILAGPLGRTICDFNRRNGDVDLRIHEMSPNRQILALRARHLDVAFLRSPPDDPAFVRRRVWRENLCVALPSDHELARRAQVHIADLQAEAFVVFNLRDSQFAVEISTFCLTQGFTPRISQQVVEATSLISLVAAGHGVALIPEFVSRLRHEGVVYKPLRPPGPAADVYALHRANPGPIVDNFVSMSRHTFEDTPS